MTHERFGEFLERLGEVIDLRAAAALLQWDQEVYMPPKGAEARGRQLATLSALAHRQFTCGAFGELLTALNAARGELTADQARLVDEARYDYDRATRLPERFVEAFAKAQSEAFAAWRAARGEARFALFEPHLARMVELLRERASHLGYTESPYDALLEDHERGMTKAQLDRLFSTLAPAQAALIERILSAPKQPDLTWIDQDWDESAQWAFTERVLRDMGYDFDAGRQDVSPHPFTTNFDMYDVRVTTRMNRRELFSALTGSMHEGGHALYEQGFLPSDRRTLLAEAPSLGIHESQSRLWENIIGRSLPFWKHYAPLLRAQYPGQLEHITAEQMVAALNRVQPSLIRVEADECTYNLHIILRFEIEVALIEGRLAVADVPEAWNARMKSLLGIDVPNDALGCLQDIHWSHGSMGYFPTYTLGNLYAAQLFEKIEADLPGVWADVERGDFAPLREWLRRNVHAVGRRMTAPELVRRVTGKEPSEQPYLAYLTKKYGALYGC